MTETSNDIFVLFLNKFKVLLYPKQKSLRHTKYKAIFSLLYQAIVDVKRACVRLIIFPFFGGEMFSAHQVF